MNRMLCQYGGFFSFFNNQNINITHLDKKIGALLNIITTQKSQKHLKSKLQRQKLKKPSSLMNIISQQFYQQSMQPETKKQLSASKRRLDQINQQEKQLASIFALSNFYKEDKLDLQSLKQKIKDVQIKRSAIHEKLYQSISYQPVKPNQKIQRRQLINRKKIESNAKVISTSFTNNNPQIQPQTRLPSASNLKTLKNKRYVPRLKEYKKESKLKQQHKDRNINKFQPILSDFIIKISVDSIQQLGHYEHKIQSLWGLYELLTKIIRSVQQNPISEQISLIKYVEDICSEKFEFILQLLQKKVPKKYHKTIILSRLLQNISIIYLSLQQCQKKRVGSVYLVNFIGYCTSNLVFLIRLFTLFHEVKVQPCKNVINIIQTIRMFELQSYKEEILSLKQLVLRMEHNNEIVNIMQVKLCSSSTPQFQTVITHFLKHADREHQPLYEYAHYIYEFLAYYLHKEQLLGVIPFLQMAPAPYLALKFPQTVVIQPWQVLFVQKKAQIFVRAYTQHFITELAKRCNVILWSDLLPRQLDPLVSLLPSAMNIYYLYRYHCKYVQIQQFQDNNNNYVKILWRTGCLPDNAIIIDRTSANFSYNLNQGIELPWKGQRKDKKLLDLLQLLLPLFNNSKKLSDEISSIREQINLITQKKSQNFRRKKINELKHLKGLNYNMNEQQLQQDV